MTSRRSRLVVSSLLWMASVSSVQAGTSDHKYQANEHVELWVNKVGPYANPQEAYEYYTLPYCAPDTKHHPDVGKEARHNELKTHSLGERLGGHALRHSGHDLTFPKPGSEECTTPPLTATQTEAFRRAASDQWFYQMYLDDLPVWGMVGEMLPEFNDKVANQKNAISDLDHLDQAVVPGVHSSSTASTPDHLKAYVYTTRTLTVSYNGNRIVKVDLTSDPASLKEIKEGIELNFKLLVKWESTTHLSYHSRFDRYLDHAFFKHQIHWFSIFNSFMMVLFLMGLVALILLRTLRKDYARYALSNQTTDSESLLGLESGSSQQQQPMVDENGKPMVDQDGHVMSSSMGGNANTVEDSGWKQVHGDVFRAPALLPLFAAILGTGWQLIILTLGVILFAVAGPLHGQVHEERGEVLHAIIVCYSLSSIVAGYASGKFFKQYDSATSSSSRSGSGSSSSSTNIWQATMALTVFLLPTVTVAILSILNTVSLYYGTINTIPFLVIVKLFFLWIFVSVPLCVVGTLMGRHSSGGGGGAGGAKEHFPCRVNAIPRPIPENVPWYGKPQNLIPFCGLLSFGSIFIELYYVLTSLWNYKFYHVYGFLLGVYAILTIVVGMTTIICVYFCLNAEHYLWQWTAFGCGASTAVYVFLYGVYYFIFKTSMNGILQTMFYFGYMSLIALNLGTLCGTLGHMAASKFVQTIFQNVKVD